MERDYYRRRLAESREEIAETDTCIYRSVDTILGVMSFMGVVEYFGKMLDESFRNLERDTKARVNAALP